MRASLVFALAAAAALPGCAVVGGAVVVGAMADDTARYYGMDPDGKAATRAPEPDPKRKINEQDCTKPIDLNGGNLRCK
jgi:hypothetical protein